MTAQIHFKAGPGSAPNNLDVPKRDIGGGMLVQYIGSGENMNAVHWNLPDGSIIPRHNHPQEQFGYVIRGGFEAIIDGVGEFKLKAGDSYFIPSNLYHEFKAIGETEAVDVFAPLRDMSTIGGRPQQPDGEQPE